MTPHNPTAPTQTRNVLEVDEQEDREEQGQGEGLSSRATEVVRHRVHVIPCSRSDITETEREREKHLHDDWVVM